MEPIITLEKLDEATARMTIRQVPHVGTVTQTGKLYALDASTLGGLIGDWIGIHCSLEGGNYSINQLEEIVEYMVEESRVYLMSQAMKKLLDNLSSGAEDPIGDMQREYLAKRKQDNGGSISDLADELAAKLESRATADLPAHLQYLFGEIPDSDYPLGMAGNQLEMYAKNDLSLAKCCDQCGAWVIFYRPLGLSLWSVQLIYSLNVDDVNNEELMKRYLWWCSAIDLTGAIRVDPDNERSLQYHKWVTETLGVITEGIMQKDYEKVHKVLGGKVEVNSINESNYRR